MPALTDLKIDAKTAAAVVMGCFALYFFIDGRYAEERALAAAKLEFQEDIVEARTDMLERILMSDSTRYAEIEKYYTDELQEGHDLSEAQKTRLALVQKQQIRIGDAIKGDTQ